MRCSNPACRKDDFKVTVQHRMIDAEHPDRLPVKLVCVKCTKPVKAWITNVQMKEMLAIHGRQLTALKSIALSYEHLALAKPWWKFW